MATQPNANAKVPKPTQFKSDDDIPDIPTEHMSSDTDSATLDNDMTFEGTQYDEDYKKVHPPGGDWQKDDRWEYRESVNTSDILPGDKNINGRTLFTAYGKPIPRTEFDVEHQPVLFVRMSPDRRYKADDATKFDLAYKLFMQAREAYLTIHGEQMNTIDKVRYFLAEDNYIVRTMKGDNGPIVVDIKVKQERKHR